MNLLVFLLTVTALTNSLAESRQANKRADGDNSELETMVMKLSADLSQLTAQNTADVNRLETKIASLETELGESLTCGTGPWAKISSLEEDLNMFLTFGTGPPDSGEVSERPLPEIGND